MTMPLQILDAQCFPEHRQPQDVQIPGQFLHCPGDLRKYDLQVLRFFMLSAHYRSPLNFSADLMEAAKNGYERIVTSVDNLKFYWTRQQIPK